MNSTRSGTLTVAGVASQPGANLSSVSVSGTGLTTGNATVYADGSWAKTGATLADGNNTYTATATDTYGRTASDTINLSLPSTNSFAYDYNGNLTNDGRRVFEYDYENQLTNVYVASAWRSEFRYDAFGRRRVRKEYTWTGSAWSLTNEVRYVYDGMLAIQERDVNNLALVSYTRGNDRSGSVQGAGGIGGLLARTDHSTLISQPSTAHAYYHADGNGNITAMVDTNGILVAKYNYDPYGNLLGMSGLLAEANAYRFSSKEYASTAGLYYYGYRFYEPKLQRWLNQDPIREMGGVNLFAMAFGDTVNFVDPLGLECNGTFDRTTGILTLTDKDTGESVTVKAFSGNGASVNKAEDEHKVDEGPIPKGEYLIGQKYSHKASPGDNQWYKLYGPNGKGGYSYENIPVKDPNGKEVIRGLLNLHTGSASDGCLTVPSEVKKTDPSYPTSKEFDKIKALLDKTKPLIYNGTPFTGKIVVK